MKDATYYQPTSTPIASLLIAHGMAEHQGRYAKFAQFLADNGIVVMTFDHLGHGQSAKDHNTLGFMGNPEPAERMIAHVMRYANQLATDFPDIPQFVLGHSMGSFLTRCLLGRFGTMFAGAVIVGTSASNPLNAAFVPITQLFNRLAPTKPNPLLDKALNTINNLPFRHEPSLQGFNWLNSDVTEVEHYLADPLCGFGFTNNGYYALMSLMAEGTGKDWADAVPKHLSMFFLSGQDDPIGQMGKGIPQIVDDLRQRGFDNVSVQQYPTMRHEILLETNQQVVYQDILTWLLTTYEAINLQSHQEA